MKAEERIPNPILKGIFTSPLTAEKRLKVATGFATGLFVDRDGESRKILQPLEDERLENGGHYRI